MPDAASEIAYTGAVFPRAVSFATGWVMTLAYAVVCPWEAVAIGKLGAYIVPALNSHELYRIAGKAVFLPHLVLGLGLTAVITAINYRGIRLSATFQNWTTFGLLALFVAFGSFGLARGSLSNFPPLFSRGGPASVLLVIQIVPYFMTGFESVAKCSEEAGPDFRTRGFFRAIVLAILVGIVFYTAVIAVVAYVAPWPTLVREPFATAVAFERALGSRWIVSLIFAAALLSLLKVFNGNFVAASRLLFALGRRGLLETRLGQVHPGNRTPAAAVLALGLLSGAAVFLGEAILIPITEVGSLASAVGWLATCAAYWRMRPSPRDRTVAGAGFSVGALLVLMKIVPAVPGHFSRAEFLALAAWLFAGWLAKRRALVLP